MKWNIVTDSSCDLFPGTLEDSEIQISSVPFIISVGDRDFIDDETLDTAISGRMQKFILYLRGGFAVTMHNAVD